MTAHNKSGHRQMKNTGVRKQTKQDTTSPLIFGIFKVVAITFILVFSISVNLLTVSAAQSPQSPANGTSGASGAQPPQNSASGKNGSRPPILWNYSNTDFKNLLQFGKNVLASLPKDFITGKVEFVKSKSVLASNRSGRIDEANKTYGLLEALLIGATDKNLVNQILQSSKSVLAPFTQDFLEPRERIVFPPIGGPPTGGLPLVSRNVKNIIKEIARKITDIDIAKLFSPKELGDIQQELTELQKQSTIDETTLNLLTERISERLPKTQTNPANPANGASEANGAGANKTQTQTIRETRVVEKETKIVETQVVTCGEQCRTTNEAKINELTTLLDQLKKQQIKDRQDLFNAIALTNRINTIPSNTTINNVTITNPSFANEAITDAMVIDTITASNYLPLGGGTMVGNLLTGSATSIGIGTTSPSQLLSVQGNALLAGTTTVGVLHATSTIKVGTSSPIVGFGSGLQITKGFLESTGGSGATTFLALTDTQSSFTANRIIHTDSGATALTDTAGFVFDGTSLGIGTTTPSQLLSVQGGALISGTTTLSGFTATGSVLLATAGNRVGIGTLAPATILHLSTSNQGEIARFESTGASGFVKIGVPAGNNAASLQFDVGIGTTPDAEVGFDPTNGLGFFVNLDGARKLVMSQTTGLVGISTTTPSQLLSVQGNALISGTTTVGVLHATSTVKVGTSSPIVGFGSGLQITKGFLESTGGSGATTFLALTDTQSSFTANRIIHTDSGATALTDTAGFVFDGTSLGIGTTTPSQLLSVQGNILTSATTTTGGLIATGTTLLATNGGNVGIGTTSPRSSLAVPKGGLSVGYSVAAPTDGGIIYGTVGIGTTAPVGKLNVFVRGKTTVGLMADAGLVIGGSASNPSVNNIYQILLGTAGGASSLPIAIYSIITSNASYTTADLVFATRELTSDTAPIERTRITSSGNLGISTTTPSQLLSVQGGALISGTTTVQGLIATSTLYVGSLGSPNFIVTPNVSGGMIGIGTTTPSQLLSVQGNALISGTTTVGGLLSTSSVFSVLPSGEVGIGTVATPAGPQLLVIGNSVAKGKAHIEFGNSLASSGSVSAALAFRGQNINHGGIVYAPNDSQALAEFRFTVGGSGDVSNNTRVFVLRGNGDIGISTTTPSQLLSVHGNALIAGTTTVKELIATGTIYARGISTNITGNGVCIVGDKSFSDAGAAACIPSALRFKQNISPFDISATDKLIQLQVVNFEYKHKSGQPRVGLIAEDVEKVDKNLVAYDTEGQPLSLHFEDITALLVKSVQELKGEMSNIIQNAEDKVIDTVKKWLGGFRVFIEDGLVRLKELVADAISTKKLCLEDVCIEKTQLKALLDNANLNSAATTGSTSLTTRTQQSATQETQSPNNPVDSGNPVDTEPPVITLNGPSVIDIEVGVSWSDPGATVSDNINDNLSIYYKVDGVETGNGGRELPQIDTSIAGNHTITYISTDAAGNTISAERTVTVIDPNPSTGSVQDAAVGTSTITSTTSSAGAGTTTQQ